MYRQLLHIPTMQDVTFVVIQYRQWTAFLCRFPVPYLVRKTNIIIYHSPMKECPPPTFGLTFCIGSKYSNERPSWSELCVTNEVHSMECREVQPQVCCVPKAKISIILYQRVLCIEECT